MSEGHRTSELDVSAHLLRRHFDVALFQCLEDWRVRRRDGASVHAHILLSLLTGGRTKELRALICRWVLSRGQGEAAPGMGSRAPLL